MEVVKDALNSKLNISDDVIITIARLATLDVKGVAGLSGEINALSRIKNNAPIKINMIGDVASIDVRIKVKGLEKACVVAQEVQSTIKENVQNMTGIPVACVNVIITGAVFD